MAVVAMGGDISRRDFYYFRFYYFHQANRFAGKWAA
jgi:hypothetical protein